MKPTIYLDMDGVCTDFASAGIIANGRNPSEVFRLWHKSFRGEYHAYKVMGIDMESFWEAVTAEGEAFWVNLQEYAWYSELLGSLQNFGEVLFLTSGSYAPRSLSGKLQWLQIRFGKDFRGYVMTARKHLLAKPGTILIDDYEANVLAFQKHGGKAVLFPQVWNREHGVTDSLGFTLESVERLANTM
jgi:5'(3')-deoxyribonucleotidase